MRGEEAKKDVAFVKNLCEKYNVPCRVISVGERIAAMTDSHQSLEEKARIARYEALGMVREEIASEAKVALAHHADDNAETLLFRLARGTGLRGLRSMEPVREEFIRPFLGVSRAEIEEYLAELGQEYCTDSTNCDVTFSRNKIRGEIMPLFREMNPQASAHMNETAHMLCEATDYIEEEVDLLLASAECEGGLSVAVLLTANAFLRKQAYLEWISRTLPGAKDISRKQIETVDALLEKSVGATVCLPRQYVVRRGYETIELIHPKKEKMPEVFIALSKSDLFEGSKTIFVQNYQLTFEVLQDFSVENLPQNHYTKWFDCDKISDNISIRTPQSGDFFIVDQEGHTKKLNRYFIDQKIPADLRHTQLLLCDGSHVIWIVGGRMSEYYKVEASTRQILQIQMKRGEES